MSLYCENDLDVAYAMRRLKEEDTQLDIPQLVSLDVEYLGKTPVCLHIVREHLHLLINLKKCQLDKVIEIIEDASWIKIGHSVDVCDLTSACKRPIELKNFYEAYTLERLLHYRDFDLRSYDSLHPAVCMYDMGVHLLCSRETS